MADRSSFGFIEGMLVGANKPQGRFRVFDWNKAAEIIRDKQPKSAEAGLTGDWDWTGGVIYRDGKPVSDEYTFLGSTWAEPKLIVDEEDIPCWVYADECDFDENTKWPESALNKLKGK